MAYGLPSRGQHDWDDELNNSMEYVRGQAETAKAQSDSAISTANAAYAKAQSVEEFVEAPTDTQIATKINEDGSATKTALTASYATKGPAISGDTTGATDAAAIQSYLWDVAAAGGGTCYFTQAGTYLVNTGIFKPWNVNIVIGSETTWACSSTFPFTQDLLQDSIPTTVAAGSNGAATSAATLNVADTSAYPSAGQVRVAVTGGTAIIAYTGKTATSFTGCTQYGGYVGTFTTGDRVSARTQDGVITGGGTLDSRNRARHGLYAHYFAGLFVGVKVQNSVEHDIVLGDGAAVAASYQARLRGNDAHMLVDRGSNYLTPSGCKSVYVTQYATDGGFVGGRVVIKGQETGLHIDGAGNWGGAIHCWGSGMKVGVFDNGTDNHLDMVCDTVSVYGLELGVTQDRARHRGLIYNNPSGLDNVVVAIRNDGGAKDNMLDFDIVGATSSNRFAQEYQGNYDRSRLFLRSKNVAGSTFRRDFASADALTSIPARRTMGASSGTTDMEDAWTQNNGIVGTKVRWLDYKGGEHANGFYGPRQSGLKPTAATFETVQRTSGLSSGSILASGTLYLVAIELPSLLQVNSITFVSGNTAASSPTAWWFGLYDQNRVQLATTADQGSAAWGTFAAKTLNIAATAAGAASSFTTTYSGLYYLGIMVAATTVPTLTIAVPGTAVPGLPPILYGSSDTGQSTPPAFPKTAGAITAVNGAPYAYVA